MWSAQKSPSWESVAGMSKAPQASQNSQRSQRSHRGDKPKAKKAQQSPAPTINEANDDDSLSAEAASLLKEALAVSPTKGAPTPPPTPPSAIQAAVEPQNSTAEAAADAAIADGGAPPVTGADSPLVIGVLGTGPMGSAQAFRWAQHGFKVVIGSRDKSRGEQAAARIGKGCVGTSQEEMCHLSNVIIICVNAGHPFEQSIDKFRKHCMGKGKVFVDLLVAYSRYFGDAQRPNGGGPPYSTTIHGKERMGDSTAAWVKCFANLAAGSVRNRRVQPVEVAGDEVGKAVCFKLLKAAGFEPLDCGGMADCPKIEPGYHPRRWKHPRHLEFNGANHP